MHFLLCFFVPSRSSLVASFLPVRANGERTLLQFGTCPRIAVSAKGLRNALQRGAKSSSSERRGPARCTVCNRGAAILLHYPCRRGSGGGEVTVTAWVTAIACGGGDAVCERGGMPVLHALPGGCGDDLATRVCCQRAWVTSPHSNGCRKCPSCAICPAHH
jgi:hypothetical protein